MSIQSRIYKIAHYSTHRLLIYFIVGILFLEFCTMLVIDILPPLPALITALIDCSILSIFLAPAVYFFVIRPENKYQIERKRAKAALKESETHFHTLANSGQALIWTSVADKKFDYLNQPWLAFTGQTLEHELGDGWVKGIHPDDLQQWMETYTVSFESREKFSIEYRLMHSSGDYHWIQNDGSPRYNSENEFIGYIGHCLDITERKQVETYREMSREVLQILYEPGTIFDLIIRVITLIKNTMGVEAVGIRLKDGEDFPYFAQKGFSDDFLFTENNLIELDRDGTICRDSNGNSCLACTCGLVLSGKNNPDNLFFTQGGSWWTNDSSQLLDIKPAKELRFLPRNKCIEQGFASLALVPIRNKNEIIGLIQFSDLHKNRFTKAIIEKLEGIALYIGAALVRSHNEELIREKEKKRLSILQTAMDGFWLIDCLGCLMEVNETYCRMSGYSSQELLTMKIYDLEVNENKEDTFEHIKKIILNGEDRFESRHRRKDGSIFDVEISAQYQPIEGGQFVVFLHDITKRKQSDENLRQSEERYKSLFKNNHSVMLLIDPDTGEIKDANPAACKYYGWAHADLISKNISEINTLAKEDIETNLQNSKAQKNNHLFFQHRLANGEKRYVEVYSGPITFSGSTLLYSIVHDITESKIAQDELIESELKFRKYVDHAPHGIFVTNENGEYIEVNSAGCKITGYTREELLSMKLFELMHEESLESSAHHFNRLVSEGFATGEFAFIKKDRSKGYWSVDAVKMSDKIFLGFVVDITNRKLTEDALSENERLLRESQAAAHLGSYSADLIHKTWKASPEMYEIFGIDESYPPTLETWTMSIHPDFREQLTKDLFQTENKESIFEHEYKIFRFNDGAERWVHGLGQFEYDDQMNPVRLVGTIHDITSRKEKEEALRKLNMTLSALSKSNLAMSQSTDEADYLKQVCKNVVEDTEFAMVWIGFAQEDEAKTVRPVASAGFKDDYLESIKISWGDNDLGRGPTGVAIRTGKMSMCTNMFTDPNFEPWREQALKRGYASSIVFPLKTGDKTFGAITIYSKKIESFFEAEIKLFAEMANDLAQGITTIRLRAAHQLAEMALIKSHNELEGQVKERTLELEIANNLLVQEINIRKEQEQTLKLAEEKYRTVANFTHDWEYWISPENTYNYISPSCENITGHKAEEFIQNPGLIFNIVHPDDLKAFHAHQQNEIWKQECHDENQFRIIRPDGSVRWIGNVRQTVYDESGNFIGIRGSNRDITERKNLEQLLKTNNRKYRLLSENITDGIFICQNECFEYVNRAMNHLFGYDGNELIGLKLSQLILPEYLNELDFISNQKALISQIRGVELECFKKDGAIIFVEFLFNYLAKEGIIYGVAHDITEKKLIQRNIVKAIILTEEKERAHFSKELHDGLGPLLSTIKLYLQWSERAKSDESREEIIRKAEDIIEDALTAVKEISNKLSPHLLTNYGLASAIRSFVEKLEETSAIHISFECILSRRLGSEIEAAVYRAVIECINNTIKYSEAKNITINLDDLDSELLLRYRDDGIGFNLSETLAIKKGLGLFNLQNRIQNIGGKITMYSEPGKGVDYQIIVNL